MLFRSIIVYSLSLGFLLFTVVAYTMEFRAIQLHILSKQGSYINVYWTKIHNNFTGTVMLEDSLRSNYSNEIEDFGWTTTDLYTFPKSTFIANWLSDFGRKETCRTDYHGIPPNFFEIANERFINVYASNETTGLSLGEQLYTPRGSQGVIIGSFSIEKLSANIHDPNSTFLYIIQRTNTDLEYEMKAISMLNSCPKYTMRRRPRVSQNVIGSIPLYLKMIDTTSFTTTRFDTLMIKIKDGDEEKHKIVYEGLKEMALDTNKNMTVWSYSKSFKNNINSKRHLRMLISCMEANNLTSFNILSKFFFNIFCPCFMIPKLTLFIAYNC